MSDQKQNKLPPLGFAKEMDEEDRVILGDFGDFTVAEAGQEIITEGKPQDSLFLVVSGTLHVQTAATGRTILLGTLVTGDTIGEINIFDPGEASATVLARDFSVLWSMSRDRLHEFLEQHPKPAAKLLNGVAQLLSKRLRKTNEKVAVAQEVMSQTWSS